MHGPLLLKRLLLVFWATWFTIVCDAAKATGLLDDSWASHRAINAKNHHQSGEF